jgi:glucokinase
VKGDGRIVDKGNATLLCGDIGGTETVLGLFSVGAPPAAPVATETYASREHPDLESIVTAFLADASAAVTCASFAVAGPVRGGSAEVTNLPWRVDAIGLQGRFGIPKVVVFNDVQALAESIPTLDAGGLETLHRGDPDPFGTIAVVAPGTGCGEAYLVWDGVRYVAHPSEGGHSDFAPADSDQIELLRFLRKEFGHVSVERVCSGPGLHNIYRFLHETHGFAQAPAVSDRIASASDPARAISEAALAGESDLCLETLRVFFSALGSEAGNLALKVLATGGIYLGGGIPRRNLRLLQTEDFLRAVARKGRFAPVLRKAPIHVVTDPLAVLRGAACRGIKEMSL